MITIPFDTVLEKLKAHGLSDEEIKQKIKQKMDQLSGLISQEGAAHIIANELGIKLIEKTSGRLKIKDVFPGMRNVEAVGKVTNVFDLVQFQRQDGNPSKVRSIIIGDETGTIKVACWGSQTDSISELKQNDIVKIISGYVKTNQGRKEIHLNDNSKILINPPGETIGDISISARQFDRKKIDALVDNMSNVEIMGTVVGVDALRFFEICPQCQKRARMKRDEFECETHGIVDPDYSYVMNLIVDDGTSSIRVVCFNEMVEKVLSVNRRTLLDMRDVPDLNNVKNKLLGTIVKFKGRSKKNQMFDRLEFSAQDADINPDPYEEMAPLDSEIEKAKQSNEVTSLDEI
jgi:ssDNA-binding replication factor A large subunit